MFEIGTSLREARVRQNLDLLELEQQTKIRSKYLKALEDEQFDILPAPTYVKGFLRNYADALGLDGQIYVDEYNSRFITGEEDVPLRPRDYQRRPQPLGHHRVEPRGILLAVGAIAVVFALVIAAWKYGTSNNGTPASTQASPRSATSAKKHHRRASAPVVRLVLTAASGSSWLQIRAGGPGGKVKYEGTLQQGTQLPFNRKPWLFGRLWIAASKPANLVAKLNGRVRLIPGHGQPEQLIVTPYTIRKAPPPT